jgi:hypothetical protein
VFVGPSERNAHPESDEYTKQLNDVGVGHRVQPPEKSVENGNAGAENDASSVIHVDDDAQSGPESCENPSRPEHLSAEGREEEEASHPLAERVLQRIQHGDVTLLPHLIGEEDPSEDQTEGVPEGRLAPDQPRGVNDLGRAVDVASTDPRSYKTGDNSRTKSRGEYLSW